MPSSAPDPVRHPEPAAPEFVTRVLRRTPQSLWRWLAAVLIVLLCVQLLVVERDRLAERAWARPWLERACALFGCELAPWYAPQDFAVLSHDVRPYPDTGNGLRMSLSFRNDAPFAQDWPILEVRFLDINGRITGVRRFVAREYLGAEPARRRIASGQTVNAELALLDPGQNSLSYEFQFL